MLRQTSGSVANVANVIPDPCGECDVRTTSICRAVPSSKLSALADHLVVKRFAPGEAIIFDGDDASAVYNLTEGAAKVFKSLPDGRRAVIGFLFAGDFLGFAEGDIYNFGAEALGPTRVCRFPRTVFQDLLVRLPELEAELLERATHELDAAQEHILLLSRKTAMERVSSLIGSLAKRASKRREAADIVRFLMTRADMADYLGLTTETVSRVFTKLKGERVIQLLDPSSARILRPERLSQLASGDVG